jgi:Tol biopolymer transport system component
MTRNDEPQTVSQPIERNSAGSLRIIKLLVPAAILIVGVMATGFWYAKSKSLQSVAPVLSAPFSSEKLSTDGKVPFAVVSPDGKNVVYTNGMKGKQSVWFRQLESANNVEIIPPSDDSYFGLALSPEGDFLYFVRAPKGDKAPAAVYRMSIFGGIPTKIADETQGWISISPDGAKISFVRCYYRDDEYCSLWIADSLDGKNERKLVSRSRPLRIGANRISPDGKSVAFAVGQSNNQANEFALMEVDIESGAERELT